ncbi:MAG: hypothetical protein PVJ39_20380 [Gammaproteobacteria bacterium]|jgi:hypothetical protein
MSALQVRWLTEHLSQGKITREEFASLYTLVASTTQNLDQGTNQQRRTVPRLHPVTRRILVQIRMFKAVARAARNLLLIGVMCACYLAWEAYHQESGQNFNISAITGYFTGALFTGATLQPLPSGIKPAAEYLSDRNNWQGPHIKEFDQRWQTLTQDKQNQYRETEWFRAFSLALALQIADQRALAKSGNVDAARRQQILKNLAQSIKPSAGAS